MDKGKKKMGGRRYILLQPWFKDTVELCVECNYLHQKLTGRDLQTSHSDAHTPSDTSRAVRGRIWCFCLTWWYRYQNFIFFFLLHAPLLPDLVQYLANPRYFMSAGDSHGSGNSGWGTGSEGVAGVYQLLVCL